MSTTAPTHHCYKRFQLTTTQQALVASVEKMVWKFAHSCTPASLRRHPWAVEESYDVAIRHACLAAYQFEFPRGLEFSTYALGCVKINVYNHWRRWRKNSFRHLLSLDDSSDGVTLGVIVPGIRSADFEQETDNRDSVEVLLSDPTILERERMVICQVFGYGVPEKRACEVAADLRVSRPRINEITRNALVKLRRRAIQLGLFQ